MTKQLVLCSSSVARKKLLEKLNLRFEIYSPDVDESLKTDENVEQIVQRLSLAKAKTAAERFPNAILIGADTLGALDKIIFGKPLSHEKAAEQLTQCSGQTVRFYTGLAVYDTQNQQLLSTVEHYDVTFRNLSSELIQRYLQIDQPYHCAGSIYAEGLALRLIATFAGNDPNTLIGLPLLRLIDFLEQLNFKIIV